jgi:hypothetical protein
MFCVKRYIVLKYFCMPTILRFYYRLSSSLFLISFSVCYCMQRLGIYFAYLFLLSIIRQHWSTASFLRGSIKSRHAFVVACMWLNIRVACVISRLARKWMGNLGTGRIGSGLGATGRGLAGIRNIGSRRTLSDICEALPILLSCARWRATCG